MGTPPLPEDLVGGQEKGVNENTKILIDFLNSLPTIEQRQLKSHFLRNKRQPESATNSTPNLSPPERKKGILNLPPETQMILNRLQQKGYTITEPRPTYAESVNTSHGGSSSCNKKIFFSKSPENSNAPKKNKK